MISKKILELSWALLGFGLFLILNREDSLGFIGQEFGHGITFGYYSLISIGSALLVMVVELFFVGPKNSSLYDLFFKREKTSQIDLYFFILLNSGAVRYFSCLAFLPVHLFLRKLGPILNLNLLEGLNPLLSFVVVFMFSEFFDYWDHRIQHKFKFFWEMHKVHHSARRLNVITLFRVHEGDAISSLIIKGIPLSVLGLSLDVFFAYMLFEQLHHFLVHSRLEWKWGWIGRYIIFSPYGHLVHHSKAKTHHNKNFGNLTPIYDHLFGTYYEGAEKIHDLGVEDDNVSYLGPLALIYRPYFRGLRWLSVGFREYTTRALVKRQT